MKLWILIKVIRPPSATRTNFMPSIWVMKWACRISSVSRCNRNKIFACLWKKVQFVFCVEGFLGIAGGLSSSLCLAQRNPSSWILSTSSSRRKIKLCCHACYKISFPPLVVSVFSGYKKYLISNYLFQVASGNKRITTRYDKYLLESTKQCILLLWRMWNWKIRPNKHKPLIFPLHEYPTLIESFQNAAVSTQICFS